MTYCTVSEEAFPLEHFRAWLLAQPNKSFAYHQRQRCAFAQYLTAHGMSGVTVWGTYAVCFNLSRQLEVYIGFPRSVTDALYGFPRTFHALAQRLGEMQ